MKIAVIGAGSIGKRHIGNLITKGVSPSDILIVDPRPDRLKQCKAIFDTGKILETIDELASNLDAALICSPTSFHIKQAIAMAKRGAHLFIEKPLAHDLSGIDELNELIAKRKLKALIAYPFRFSEHGRKLKKLVDEKVVGEPLYVYGQFSEYLPDWHPWEDYRTFYMTKKNQGGGSLLDQSHIMDMAHWCFGRVKEVFGFNGKVSQLEGETDDFAEMQVRFDSGLVGTIHQDMFGRKHTKYLEVKCTQGNILWDVYQLSVEVFYGETKKSETYYFGRDHQIMYLNEIEHFLQLLRGKEEESLCTLEEGIHGMKIIEAVLRSQKSGRLEKVL